MKLFKWHPWNQLLTLVPEGTASYPGFLIAPVEGLIHWQEACFSPKEPKMPFYKETKK